MVILKSTKFLIAVFCFAVLAIVGIASASSCTHFVAKNGNDANPGTEAQPWLTINYATHTATAPGDTICVKSGTYNERVQFDYSGTANHWITLQGYPGHTVTIDGSGISMPSSDHDGLVQVNNKNYIRISNLRIVNTSRRMGGGGGGAGILIKNSPYTGTSWHDIMIDHISTYNTQSSGINAWGGGGTGKSKNLIITNNDIELCANTDGDSWSQECLSFWNVDGFEVAHNKVHVNGAFHNNFDDNIWRGGEGIDGKDGVFNGAIHDNEVYRLYRKWNFTVGIYLDGQTMGVRNVSIYNNYLHEVYGYGIAVNSEQNSTINNVYIYNNILADTNVRIGSDLAIYNPGTIIDRIYVFNNIIYTDKNITGQARNGITCDNYNIPNSRVWNNIVTGFGRTQINGCTNNRGWTVDHNLLYPVQSTSSRGTDYIIANPQFVNINGPDFHLQSTSPAINAGSSTNASSFDFDNNARPIGAGYDIGAYEYCTGSGCVTATNPSPDPQPSTTSLSLKSGWNQISSPLAAGIDISTMEAAGCTILPYKTHKFWAWNAQTQTWINPSKVEPFRGYWIYAAYQCTVPLSGTQAAFTSLPLSAGWNKISASGDLNSIKGGCQIVGNWVWHWDKATEKWIHPATMELSKGYWIKVDQNCVLGG